MTRLAVRTAVDHPLWPVLKDSVARLRPLQAKDGSVEPAEHASAHSLVVDITTAIDGLAPLFPHDEAYLGAVVADFRRWSDGGFGRPDFLDSLVAFRPEQARRDGLEHLVVERDGTVWRSAGWGSFERPQRSAM